MAIARVSGLLLATTLIFIGCSKKSVEQAAPDDPPIKISALDLPNKSQIIRFRVELSNGQFYDVQPENFQALLDLMGEEVTPENNALKWESVATYFIDGQSNQKWRISFFLADDGPIPLRIDTPSDKHDYFRATLSRIEFENRLRELLESK